MRNTIRLTLAAVLGAVFFVSAAAAGPGVPAPRDVLGFTPGEDRKLADYATVAAYFRKLSETSDRVRLEEIGPTTLGKPMLLATISSPANLARLDRLQDVQR